MYLNGISASSPILLFAKQKNSESSTGGPSSIRSSNWIIPNSAHAQSVDYENKFKKAVKCSKTSMQGTPLGPMQGASEVFPEERLGRSLLIYNQPIKQNWNDYFKRIDKA